MTLRETAGPAHAHHAPCLSAYEVFTHEVIDEVKRGCWHCFAVWIGMMRKGDLYPQSTL